MCMISFWKSWPPPDDHFVLCPSCLCWFLTWYSSWQCVCVAVVAVAVAVKVAFDIVVIVSVALWTLCSCWQCVCVAVAVAVVVAVKVVVGGEKEWVQGGGGGRNKNCQLCMLSNKFFLIYFILKQRESQLLFKKKSFAGRVASQLLLLPHLEVSSSLQQGRKEWRKREGATDNPTNVAGMSLVAGYSKGFFFSPHHYSHPKFWLPHGQLLLSSVVITNGVMPTLVG